MKLKKLVALLTLILIVVSVACSQSSKKEAKVSESDLLKKASKAETAGNFQEAVDIYKNIADNYPDSPIRDKALFMTGYLKSENLNQKKEALTYFNELIQEYPNSDLVDDAQFMIKAIDSGKDALSTFEENTSNK